MPPDDSRELPDGALRLLLGPIDSFEKLEAVIALCAPGDTRWTLEVLERRTGAPANVLSVALDELAAAGLVARQPGGAWRIAPACDDAGLGELVQACSTRRAAVLDLMTRRAVERIRSSAARAFADAFSLRHRPKRDRGDNDG